jgi:hypothetical protein
MLFTATKYLEEHISSIRKMHNCDNNWTYLITKYLMVNNLDDVQYTLQTTTEHRQ